MCINIPNKLISSHCFNFLEKADAKAGSIKGCCGYAVQAITRLFLLVVIPAAVSLDLLLTSIPTLMIIPLCCLGVKHLKNTAVAWLLLPSIPVIMLVYLIQGKTRCCGGALLPGIVLPAPPLPPEGTGNKPYPLRGHLSGLPDFTRPTQYPANSFCKAVAAGRWQVAEEMLKEYDPQKKIPIKWGSSHSEISVTLLEFVILMAAPQDRGLFVHSYKDRLDFALLLNKIYLIYSDPSDERSLLRPHRDMAPILKSFIKVLVNACNEERLIWKWGSQMSSTTYFDLLRLASLIQDSLPYEEDQDLVSLVERGKKRMSEFPFSSESMPEACVRELQIIHKRNYFPFLDDQLKEFSIPFEVSKTIFQYTLD